MRIFGASGLAALVGVLLVVFGGGDPAGNDLRNDTWELDGVGWRRIDPP